MSRARTRLCRRTAHEISLHNIDGMRRIHFGKSAASQFMRGGSMPESSPISMLCAQLVGIQGMSGLWGSKRTYTQLGQPFCQTQPCRHTIEQVHRVFSTAHFPPYFVNMTQFFRPKFEHTEYDVSTLFIYYVIRFAHDVFLC